MPTVSGGDYARTCGSERPGGPADLGTHQDIVLLRQEMDQRFAQVDQRFEAQTRSIMVAFVTSLIGFGGLMLGAVALAH